jgi:hypothetical protein
MYLLKNIPKIIVLFALLSFSVNCEAQNQKVEFNESEQIYFMSVNSFLNLTINGQISVEDILSENKKIELFTPKFRALIDTTVFGVEKTLVWDGMKLYYSENQEPGKLTPTRLELYSNKYKIESGDLKIEPGQPLDSIIQNRNLTIEPNRNTLGIRVFNQKLGQYSYDYDVVIEVSEESNVINSITLIFWKP